VSRSSAQEVLSEKVYILFYILKNTYAKPNKAVKNGYISTPPKPMQTKGEAPKPPLTKQNGTCNAKISSNGAPNPHPLKQIGPIKFEIKKSTLNGTAKSEVRDKNNTVIKKDISLSNSSSSGESKSVNKVKSSFSNGCNGSSKGSVLREVQNNFKKDPGPSFKGDAEGVKSSDSMPERENKGCRNGASAVTYSLTKESKPSVKKESLNKNRNLHILQSEQELEKLKDL
jgi:ubiquitin carboxyl-terminal hydrolase 36/42